LTEHFAQRASKMTTAYKLQIIIDKTEDGRAKTI
jgi:hypothetical protein